ncbi:hypothetical protein RB195_020713 [Necator americanus]|uniref:Uncharacterized protein n=2 Tax=Necator americanus TaxID=51031 RepID=W2SSQ7_NECAM|nr:hypothetical protein NECAME_19195 [Necator americanus]ETN71737.1 hypothetical protein NECAME_19195 [Necator americanus]
MISSYLLPIAFFVVASVYIASAESLEHGGENSTSTSNSSMDNGNDNPTDLISEIEMNEMNRIFYPMHHGMHHGMGMGMCPMCMMMSGVQGN